MHKFETQSKVEKLTIKKFSLNTQYFNFEKVQALILPNFEVLGKITALRFIEWLQQNPDGGTISLATGKSPKKFIEWTQYFFKNWNHQDVIHELKEWQLNPTQKPDLTHYHLIQMDEYIPIDPKNEKSFLHYIVNNYCKKLGFKEEKALLMKLWNVCPSNKTLNEIFPTGKVDLTLKFRYPKTDQEQLQFKTLMLLEEYASRFEEQIKKLGGIGFFLGGIGPDGHIAFNFKGSDHNNTTHLSAINYESAATVARDFGGIENIRYKAVLTVGLSTITQNPTTTVIIIADGYNKAKICKESIENPPSIIYPATALQKLTTTRFYLTQSAASELTNQRYLKFKNSPEQINKWGCQILIDVANKKNKTFDQITTSDLENNPFNNLLIENKINIRDFIKKSEITLKRKIEDILHNLSGYHKKTFLHTSPHHDDIVLGYLPIVQYLVQTNSSHHFATLSPGFNSVTNDYLLICIQNLEKFLSQIFPLTGDKNDDVKKFIQSYTKNDQTQLDTIQARRMLRDLVKIYNVELDKSDSLDQISNYIEQIKRECLQKSISKQIQNLKSKIRDWEEELVWGHCGFDTSRVILMKLGFYSKKSTQNSFKYDEKKFINLLNQLHPDVITVASEPEDSVEHDTHTKAYKIVMQAIKQYQQKNPSKRIEIWGYRNVWSRFAPSDADLYFPVNLTDFNTLKNIFTTCYRSQVKAAMPSFEYEGSFCDFAQKIMSKQYQIIKTCLGNNFFDTHLQHKIKTAQGLCFIKKLNENSV